MKYVHFRDDGYVVFEDHVSHDKVIARMGDGVISFGQLDEDGRCRDAHADDTRELARIMRRRT